MKPVRTCIGCRERDNRDSLTRVVLAGKVVVVDSTATKPGRGAWVHLNADCVYSAVQRGGLSRSFRRSGPFEAEGLLAQTQTTVKVEG
jgi:predicted RNA-binding protein YlxR (DUF448 family)